jgi:hypothetical protein
MPRIPRLSQSRKKASSLRRRRDPLVPVLYATRCVQKTDTIVSVHASQLIPAAGSLVHRRTSISIAHTTTPCPIEADVLLAYVL